MATAPGDVPVSPQVRIARLRADVDGGRGPGASTTEFLQHTRARSHVAGQPVAELRHEVARATAVAGHDVGALAVQVAADRDRLSGTTDAVRSRLVAVGIGGSRRRLLFLGVVTVVALVLVRSRRRSSTAGSPRASRPGPGRSR